MLSCDVNPMPDAKVDDKAKQEKGKLNGCQLKRFNRREARRLFCSVPFFLLYLKVSDRGSFCVLDSSFVMMIQEHKLQDVL